MNYVKRKHLNVCSVLLLIFIFLFTNGNYIFANEININFKNSEIELNDIIDNLSGDELADVYLEVKDDPDYKKLSTDEKNIYVKNKIIENHLKPKNRFQIYSNSKYLPEGYNSLNDEEKRLVKRYPDEAITYYYASRMAYSETEKVFGGNFTDDSSDAFRHTYWNALLVNLFYGNQIGDGNAGPIMLNLAVSAAERWTTAHEYDSYGLPKIMDLNNNRLGRNIGSTNLLVRNSKLVDIVYSNIKDGKALMIVNGRLVRSKI